MMLRHAARSLARSPLLTAVAVLSLGLGIGANATIFNVVNAVQFKPLPFPDPDRLIAVSESNPREICEGCAVGASWQVFQEWRKAARSFTGLGAYHESSYALADQGEPERLGGVRISTELFPLLGVGPIIGRGIGPADDQPGAAPVVLLSHGLWSRRFGGDSGVVGRTVRVNGVSHTVIGVMPPGFAFPEYAAIWMPLAPGADRYRGANRELGVVGRLRPGITRDQAALEMRTLAARLAAERPEQNGWTAVVAPLKEDISNDSSSDGFLLALMASGFVLLIACANLANLFLARAASRARELAVRVALGAGRFRIAAHVLSEAVLLGLAGGALGLVGSLWGIRLVLGLIDRPLPFWLRLGVDWRLLGFTLLVSLLAALAFGMIPALRAARADLNETLKTGAAGATTGRREGRLRNVLVVAQVALSLVLLTGSGLMVKSFLVERHPTGLGYNPAGVLAARIELQAPRYDDPAQVRRFEQELLDRLRVQPGFEAPAIESHLFLGAFIGGHTRVHLEGAAEPVPMGRGPTHGNAVSPDYFRLLEIPLTRGRLFAPEDRPGTPEVAVVNQETARLYWPEGDPVGKRLRIDPEGPWLTVVGVVGDLSRRPMGRGTTPLLYTASAQEPARPLRVLVRFRGDLATAIATLKAVARTVDPDEPVEDILTLEQDLALQLTPIRVMMYLLGGLGVIALGLASFGIYGVMSYLVARRSRELGIRAALGAEASRLWRFVVGHAVRLALIGIVLGVGAAALLTRTLQGVLFNVRPGDPFVFSAVAVLLGGITIGASAGPARRATRVSPIEVLREE
jgi:putative ABC transport system permease protein